MESTRDNEPNTTDNASNVVNPTNQQMAVVQQQPVNVIYVDQHGNPIQPQQVITPPQQTIIPPQQVIIQNQVQQQAHISAMTTETGGFDTAFRPVSVFKIILWVLTLGLAVYDYYTDMKLASFWVDGPCTNLPCGPDTLFIDVRDNNNDLFGKADYGQQPTYIETIQAASLPKTGRRLRLFSSIGFALALMTKLYRMYGWFDKRNYKLRTNDGIEYGDYKMNLRFGWLVLIFEDIISIMLVISGGIALKTIVNVSDELISSYTLAIATGFCSVSLNFLWRWFTICKNDILPGKNDECCSCCVSGWRDCTPTIIGICWCLAIPIVLCVAFVMLVTMVLVNDVLGYDGAHRVYVDLGNELCYKLGHEVQCISTVNDTNCTMEWEPHFGAIIDAINYYNLDGSVKEIPEYVVPDCEGADFDWSVQCKLLESVDVNCALKWSPIGNDTVCEMDDCLFQIAYDQCESDWNIPCNFTQGHATMDICFATCIGF